MPAEIMQRIGPIPENGEDMQEILRCIDETMEMSVKTMHPLFFDKFYGGSEPVGQVSELVTAILNTATHTYHVSPVLSVMEI